MLTRRRFVSYSALASAALASGTLRRSAFAQTPAAGDRRPLRVAILGSVYARGSAMQNLADRFLAGFPWEGDWHMPAVQVVSVYVDQRARLAAARPSGYELAMRGAHLAAAGPGLDKGPVIGHQQPAKHSETQRDASESPVATTDLSEDRARRFGFHLAYDIPEALRCGGDHLAVDAVLSVAEQDNYPVNDRGEVLLPTYDFFQQCAEVFSDEKKAVPYFNYGQLSFGFRESHAMVETASRMGFALMGGSAMPVTWRLPDIDLPMGADVQEAVMVATSNPYMSDFDALEAMQSMLERRKGGETGVKAVQLLEGDAVWTAGDAGRWSRELLSSALSRSDTPQGLTVLDGRTQDLVASGVLPQLVANPAAYCVEYKDGTRATMLMLDGAVADFNIAVRISDQDRPLSTQLFLPPPPNNDWSAPLVVKIEQLYRSGAAPYPAGRTLLTSGILEACLTSRHRLNQRQETPHLALSYQPPAESQYARA
jgi:hypothetical protein